MIQAILQGKDGKKCIFLGIDAENVKRLKKGETLEDIRKDYNLPRMQ